MNNLLHPWTLIALLGLTLAGCGRSETPAPSEHGAAVQEAPKGPHNGRLLADGDFVVELAIFEDGVPPEYRAWVTRQGQPVAPEDVQLTVELARLDGEKNLFRFAPQEDFLRGDGVVTEPHSFDVTVQAQFEGKTHRWTYASYEGRVSIAADGARAAGIEVETAGPATIRDLLALYGQVAINPDAVRNVGARFPGVVRHVSKTVGEPVRAGEVLARVESDDSLQVYAVTAPIAGVVTARMTNPGEQAGAAPLFTVSDLAQQRAELAVFPRDLARIRVGQDVRLTSVDGERTTSGTITRIAPAARAANQALTVWASFDAGDGGWTPGLYVNAEVMVGGAQVPLAVRASGLQAFRDFTVVFARVGDTYEVRMLELGRRDGEYVEVLGGLKPGTEYVSGNSYLIKADIEKSGASHDH